MGCSARNPSQVGAGYLGQIKIRRTNIMNHAPKVLFIGLDAASRDLVQEWSGQGLMPNLQSLRETGSWGFTESPPAIYTGSLWPSVWTGTTPGRHGCYYNEQLRPGSYEVENFLGDAVRREPFWNELSRAGKRICVFDVPKTPVSEGLNGLHVVDWGTHDSDFLACSWPPQLIDELHRTYGSAPFRRCDWVMGQQNPEQTLKKHLMWRMDTKAAIAEDLLQRDAWDVFLTVFGESHCVGHQC